MFKPKVKSLFKERFMVGQTATFLVLSALLASGKGGLMLDSIKKLADGTASGISALSSIIEHLGTSVEWLVDKGPKGLLGVILKGRNLGEKGWDRLTRPDEPQELPQYSLDATLKVPDIDDTDLKSNDPEGPRHHYRERADVQTGWKNRISWLEKKVFYKKKEIAPQENELAMLKRRITEIEDAKVAKVILSHRNSKKLVGLKERKALGDFPKGSPLAQKISEAETVINDSQEKIGPDIDEHNQPWYTFDFAGNPVADSSQPDCLMKVNIDLVARRDKLESDLERPRNFIEAYEGQVKSIKYWITGAQKREDEEEAARKKAQGLVDEATSGTPGTTGGGVTPPAPTGPGGARTGRNPNK